MTCSRCNLELPRGAAHVNPESCIEGLKHALEQATACRECGDPVSTPLHPRCMARAAAKGGAALGVKVAERKLMEKLDDFLSGGSGERKKSRKDEGRFEP